MCKYLEDPNSNWIEFIIKINRELQIHLHFSQLYWVFVCHISITQQKTYRIMLSFTFRKTIAYLPRNMKNFILKSDAVLILFFYLLGNFSEMRAIAKFKNKKNSAIGYNNKWNSIVSMKLSKVRICWTVTLTFFHFGYFLSLLLVSYFHVRT